MTTHIRVFGTQETAFVYVAAFVDNLVQRRKEPGLGLATGSIPIRKGLSFADVVTINLDEYVG